MSDNELITKKIKAYTQLSEELTEHGEKILKIFLDRKLVKYDGYTPGFSHYYIVQYNSILHIEVNWRNTSWDGPDGEGSFTIPIDIWDGGDKAIQDYADSLVKKRKLEEKKIKITAENKAKEDRLKQFLKLKEEFGE